jgi:acetolactate synthase-1/2/3 large subunit
MYFEGRNESTFWNGYGSSFVDIGKAYNMHSVLIRSEDEFADQLEVFIRNPKPTLIELIMSDAKECKPRLKYGNAIDNQYPPEPN